MLVTIVLQARFLIGLAVFLLAVAVDRRHSFAGTKFLVPVGLVLMAVEVAWATWDYRIVHTIGNATLGICYALWIAQQFKHPAVYRPAAYLIGTGLILAIGVDLAQRFGAELFNGASVLVAIVVSAGAYAAITILLWGVSGVVGQRAPAAAYVRDLVVTALIPQFLVLPATGYELPISAVLLLLSYAAHLIVPIGHLIVAANQRENTLHQLEDNVESLLRFLSTVGDAMRNHADPQIVLSYIVSNVIEATGAESGAVLLVDEYEDVLTLRETQGIFPPPFEVPDVVKGKLGAVERFFQSQRIPLGETVLGQVAASAQPVYIPNAAKDERLKHNWAKDACYISSLVVVPLLQEDRVYGVLGLANRSGKLFGESDFERTRMYGEYASMTLSNLFNYLEMLEKREIEGQVNVAADIQQRLLPRRMPRNQSVDVFSFSQPAKGVSGDYYDVLAVDRSGTIGVLICDVAGKGVPASLVMVMIRTIVHLVASSRRDAKTILKWVNLGVTGTVEVDRFATMSFMTYNPQTRTLQYSNAGHHPALVRRADGAITAIDTSGLPIGLERDTDFAMETVELSSGDAVLLYTDGIIEAMNSDGEQFGVERLKTMFQTHGTGNSEQVVHTLTEEIESFVGRAQQHDDQTLIVLRIP